MKNRGKNIKTKQFNVHEKNKQVCQIDTMIQEFTKMADELSQQIKYEEEKAGITDINHFAYPTFAKAARDRRENLINSINDLKKQKTNVETDINETEMELKTHNNKSVGIKNEADEQHAMIG